MSELAIDDVEDVGIEEVVDDASTAAKKEEFSEVCPLDKKDLLEKWMELGLIIHWMSDQSNEEMGAISQFVEEKAEELVQNFRSISKEAKEQSETVSSIVESSTNVIIDGQPIALVEVVSRLDKLMSVMIRDIVEISKSAMSMVFVMEQVVADSEKINENLDQIFKITKDTKYLSINASIEATRAGEAGKGFAVVAHEVGELSKDTEELANSMSTMIREFMTRLKEGFSLLEGIASKDLTEQLHTKDSIDQTLQALVEQAQRQKETLENTVATSDNISQSVSKLIMAMQFQDYAKQRMQHIITASQSIQEQLQSMVSQTKGVTHSDMGIEELPEDVILNMLENFSLSKIKSNFLKGAGTENEDADDVAEEASDSNSGADEDDIELF